MRFMVIVKASEESEAADAVGSDVGGHGEVERGLVKAGVMLDGAGCTRAPRARV